MLEEVNNLEEIVVSIHLINCYLHKMAAKESTHNFSRVSCFSKDSRGRNDGRVKPLSWPFILQEWSKKKEV